MALTYVGGKTGSGTATTYDIDLTTLTGGSDSAPAVGDIVIVCTGWASISDGTPGVTTAGYTKLTTAEGLYFDDTRDANLSVEYKVMVGSADTSVTVSGMNDGAYGGATVVHVWRGIDTATPIDTASQNTSGGNKNDAVPLVITPVTPGAVILACVLGTTDSTPSAKTLPSTPEVQYGTQVSGTGTTNSAIAAIYAYASHGLAAYTPGALSGGESTNGDSWCSSTVALRPAPPYMPYHHITGSAAAVAGTTSNLAWPTPHQAGDIALLFIESQDGAVGLSTPSGFIQIGSAVDASGTILQAYWCRATSSSMATAVKAADTDHGYSVMILYRGCRSGGVPYVDAQPATKTVASTTSTAAAVTSTDSNGLVVVAITKNLDSNNPFASAQTNSNLLGITERFDAGTTAGNGGGISICDGILPTTGSSGTTAITVTECISAMLTIAITSKRRRGVYRTHE